MRAFKTNAVAAQDMEDLNASCLIMAEREDGSGSRLEIQRALSFTQEDRELGQDTYCLVTETGASYYGGIEAWALDGGTLDIRLRPEAADALGVDGGFLIQIDPASRPSVHAAMTRLVS